jgi:hypothetical protein
MDPQFLAPLIPIVAIMAFATVKIAKIRAGQSQSLPSEVTARLEALEHDFQRLERELAETQERLDFAERVLTKGRDDPRIGG